jgi:hypothetical protein
VKGVVQSEGLAVHTLAGVNCSMSGQYTRWGRATGPQNHQARTGETMSRGQKLPPGRRVRYFQNKAADHDSRIVSFGQLVLFSSETGDASLLDVSDQLAARVARDGDPESIQLEETDTNFAVGWKGTYRIDGLAFIYTDRETRRATTILGYPTQAIAREISNMFG